MKRTAFFLCFLLFTALYSCRKGALTDDVVGKTSPRQFSSVDSIPPEILNLLKQDLEGDGYLSHALNLEDEYDFVTGKKRKHNRYNNEVVSVAPQAVSFPNTTVPMRDFPTTSVSGVGTVLSSVTFTQNFGATKMYSGGNESSIAFNSMNSGSAIHAYNNTTPPAGTFLASPSAFVSGIQLPGLIGNISDIDGNIFNTPVFLLQYAVQTSSSGWSSYKNSGEVAGVSSGCNSSTCVIRQFKIKLSGTGLMNLNDVNCGGLCPSTQVQAYIYYRPMTFLQLPPGGWRSWVSADQPSHSDSKFLYAMQIRAYFIKVN